MACRGLTDYLDADSKGACKGLQIDCRSLKEMNAKLKAMHNDEQR